jgi:peroxiredoxin
MKKFITLLFLLPLFALAQNPGNFTVTGSVSGLEDGASIKILSTTTDGAVLAQGQAKSSMFIINGQLPEPGLYWLEVAGERVHIYMENSPILVKGSKADLKNIRITGSASHADFEQFRDTFNPLVAQLNAAAMDVNKEPDAAKKQELMKKYESAVAQMKSSIEKFVAQKRNSHVSPFLLYISGQFYDDPVFLDKQFQSLTTEIKSTTMGKSLAEYIAYNKVGAIGSDAIEFVQNDPNGNPVSLSSFRGKYVLVDFWASWCRPCRIENPNVVKAFKKFNNKNFTILGVSLDQDKDPWLKAIEKDGLTWTQVSDLQGWGNAAGQLYRVQGIPQNFLIGPDGKIVAKNLRGEELETKLCELLGCN